MSWIIDVEMHLESMGLTDTIKENNNTSIQDKAKTMIFIRRHLDEGLKYEYMTVKDPKVLWKDLKEIFDHQRDVTLPTVCDEWNNLRFQDFAKVHEYNYAMLRIVVQLRFCGVNITDGEMLEKTYTTFHRSHITLQQQYRLRGYQKYSELISALLVAERNTELLIKNHQSRPAGSKAFPEANAATVKNPGRENNKNNRGRGHQYRRGRGGFYNPRNNTINKKHPKEHQNKGKILMKILLGILKIPATDAVPKDIGLGLAGHPSIFVCFIRHLSKEKRRKLILSNLHMIRHILMLQILLMILMRK